MSNYRLESVDAALHVLRDINRKLDVTQQRVASGLRIQQASDNGAYWAVATTAKSDNRAYSAIQDALGLAGATMGTASAGVQSVIDIMSEIKAKLVTASESGVDKNKLNDDLTQLKQQLRSVSQAASFNGDNWVVLNDNSNPAQPRQIPSAYLRDANGKVTVNMFNYVVDIAPVGSTTSADARYLLDDRPGGSGEYGALTSDHFATEAGAAQNYVVISRSGGLAAGQVEISLSSSTTQSQIKDMMNVVEGASKQLTTIGSAFGALERRIDIQTSFTQTLQDTYTSNIGILVDANMEQEASKMKALQTQQQLGIQALSIANSSYDSVRQLFQNL